MSLMEKLLQLKYTLELSEPPTEETRKAAHKWLDHLLDANMTETSGLFSVDAAS